MEQYKTCTVCKQTKPTSSFYKNVRSPDGLLCRCKSCHKIAMAKTRARHPETQRRLQAQWRSANPEKSKAKTKKWRDKNRDALNAKARADYAENPEPIKNKMRDKYSNDPSYRANVAKRYKKWATQNPEKVQENRNRRRQRLNNSETKLILKNEIANLKRQPCYYCQGLDEITIDHVIPLWRGGRHSIGNLVAACKKCNSSKGVKTITEWKKVRGW